MCKVLVSEEKWEADLDFMVYNLAFSKMSGVFSEKNILDELMKHNIQPGADSLKRIFDRWKELGLVFEDADSYVINRAAIS